MKAKKAVTKTRRPTTMRKLTKAKKTERAIARKRGRTRARKRSKMTARKTGAKTTARKMGTRAEIAAMRRRNRKATKAASP